MFSLHGPLTLHAGALIAAPVGVALLIDRLWGEPAARWHPVVWMGAYLGWAGQRMAPDLGKNRSCRGEPSTCLRLSCWPCS
mgnify:CR=1 FL=1